MRSLKNLSFLLIILFYFTVSAQPALSDKARISLLTCGPGNELYSVFGHTAIRVADPVTGTDVVYNYGMFDFTTANFYLKFVKGDLQYFVAADYYEDFLDTYRYYNRDVYEQVLNLTYAQKQSIAVALNQSLTLKERFYTYKFIDRNCTTKAADILRAHVPGGISDINKDKGKTNRAIILEKLQGKFYESLGINLMFGYKTDKEQYNLFLPMQLLQGVDNTVTTRGALAAPALRIYTSTAKHTTPWWNNIYTFSLVMLVVLLVTRRKKAAIAYLAVTGILGVFLSTVGFYSLHEEVRLNYNALLFNPLFLVLLYFMIKNNQKGIRLLVYACLCCLGVYTGFMLDKPHLVMMLPVMITSLVVLLRQLKHKRFSRN
ncbi:hypothetical protein CHU92_14725 [Flavobacterium cyanobacteriorum]|uniref:Uncharacterized protein n=1 Tax=Flavobacterium cyanobacteriorum TaxID=2022802 RepID=A0A255YSE1_9FLAO|nr:DUF4105 domain-containing protein [Flavobacterium cyanobacteriorum]OYQ32126.1 hypothetical protein CHU92_14725 [Flavobacterium cyanobacteriorum]